MRITIPDFDRFIAEIKENKIKTVWQMEAFNEPNPLTITATITLQGVIGDVIYQHNIHVGLAYRNSEVETKVLVTALETKKKEILEAMHGITLKVGYLEQ